MLAINLKETAMFKALTALAVIGLALPAVPAFASSKLDQLLASECRSVLESQPRIVRREQVQALGPGTHVSIFPLCVGIDVQDLGNAAGLGRTIAANPVLSAALSRAGWRADDVLGIVINGNSAQLYVTRF
jgi:hypothetical protein